ncbi:MAG: ABC transporter permease [Planctomycetota bacterium]|nr:ABC transporter permease [Planctomycetota bacterium]
MEPGLQNPTMETSQEQPARSLWSDALHRLKKNRLAVFSFFIILIYLIVAVLCGAGLLATNYDEQSYKIDEKGNISLNSYSPPSFKNPLGTDIQGRDVLSRVLQGSWISLRVALTMSAIYIFIAVLLGAFAGYFGGFIDDIIQWLYQTLASIPGLLMLIALTFVLGKGLTNVAVALGLVGWVGLCRLMRAEYLKHKARDYVLAAKAQGAGPFRIMFKHIFPNTFHIVIISFSLGFVHAIMGEVVLTFVGLGAKAHEPSWGRIISEARAELAREPAVWWPLLSATVAMFIVCLAFNILGDALRDSLDPKLKE